MQDCTPRACAGEGSWRNRSRVRAKHNQRRWESRTTWSGRWVGVATHNGSNVDVGAKRPQRLSRHLEAKSDFAKIWGEPLVRRGRGGYDNRSQ